MINFIINKKNNLNHILNNLEKNSIIITNNNTFYYKKNLINKKINSVQVFNLDILVYNIYRKHFNKLTILSKTKQELFFIKAINNTSLKNYSTEIVKNIINIYNEEQFEKLQKTNYTTKQIEKINLIIQNYQTLISDKYIDKPTVYKKVINFLKNNNLYKETSFFITDIFNFNKQEIELIKAIFKNSKQTYIYFLTNEQVPGFELNYEAFQKLYRKNYKLEKLNEKLNIENEFFIKNLYKVQTNQYNNKPKNIKMYEAKNLYNEISFIGNEILKIIKNYNLLYKDFIIVSNNLNEYENYLDLIFNNFKIPYYKESQININFFKYITALLNKDLNEMISFNFYENPKKIKPLLLNKNNNSNLIELYNHLINHNIISKIDETTWNIFIEIINDLEEIFGNTKTPLEPIWAYLTKNLNLKESFLDEVKIGDLNTITNDFKVVFYIGLNEELIKLEKENILLNNFEKKKYYKNYNFYNKILLNKLNTLIPILKAKTIYLTYSNINSKGKKITPALIIKKTKEMFPNLELLNYNPTFKKEKNYKQFFYPLNLKLEKKELYLSYSSINTFNHCQFKYYCEYLLKLKDNDLNKFDARTTGTYIHYFLEKLLKNKVPKENITGMLNFIKNQYLKENDLKLTNTEKYFLNKLDENLKILWPIIYEEIKNSKFSPKHLEYNLKNNKPKNINNTLVYLTGIIDRIDVYNNYFRVIDYKTGNTKFNLDDIANGINTQLLIYLLSIDNLLPAGFFYMPSYITFKEDNDYSDYRLTGMFLNNNEIIEALGGANINNYIKAYSRGKLNKKILLSETEINNLLKYTKYLISKTATNIIAGNIKINPFKNNNLCNYCPYKGICGIERISPLYRNYLKLEQNIFDYIGGILNEMDN